MNSNKALINEKSSMVNVPDNSEVTIEKYNYSYLANRKHIKLQFVDSWPGFKMEEDPIYRALIESGRFDIEISDNPDFIVCSKFGYEHLKHDCVRIFFTGENETPDFNVFDYAIGFDYLDFGDRYFRLPLYYHYGYRQYYDLMMKRHLSNHVTDKTGFCSFVYSNGNANPIRKDFFERLSKYKRVNSGGKYLNNIGEPVSDKLEFEKKHRFHIAFENASYPGYTTEKLMQAFAAGGIPVYWGDPRICEVFNSKAFINVMDFNSIDEAIEYIVKVDSDDTLYNEIISQPALENSEYEKEQILDRFNHFVYAVFSQKPKEAVRTSRTYWNKNYIKHRLEFEEYQRIKREKTSFKEHLARFLKR